MYRQRISHLSMLLMAALLAFSLAAPVAHSQAPQASTATAPSLISASSIPNVIGAVSISGTGFTPGGAVFVALHDSWDVERHEPRWLVASASTFGPNGSQDPARGFERGGAIEAEFGMAYAVHGPNGSQDPALGFVQVDVERIAGPATGPVYGPNGSQDPARGYVPGGTADLLLGSLCGSQLMARAYDATSGEWSNVLDLDLDC